MGKNKDKKKKNIECIFSDEVLNSLSNKEKNVLKRKIDEMTAEERVVCSHTDKHGVPTLDIYNHFDCECRKCGTKFNLAKIEENQLSEAVKVLVSAINQIKVFSKNDKDDKKDIKSLGATAEQIKRHAELYSKILTPKGGKKGKKKKSDSIGRYGTSSMSLNGGRHKDW